MVESLIMNAEALQRTVTRISHEIIEKKSSDDEIVIIGIYNRGVPLATRIAEVIYDITGQKPEQGFLDITFHRDDFRERLIMPKVKSTNVSFALDGKVVLLVDDVLYTGRTVRAALDELRSFGRPSKVRLAVLVDRGHRELPIRADFVGKNIPTHEGEHVNVLLQETDNTDKVVLLRHNVK
tara:strand:- start:41082 stop:41624 length:543 start_codon:yes stop_codon:yes gene_type:complete